jgi:hypothetical protein
VKHRQYRDHDGISRDVRISLFVPHCSGKKRALRCLFRTDKRQPRRTWLVDASEGFVLRVWKEQTSRLVAELKPSDPDDLQRYMKASCAGEATLAARSWPGAAMLGIPVMSKPGADPTAILLLESRGISLEDQEHEWDADMCAMLLED